MLVARTGFVLAVAAVVATGCSSGGGSSPSATTAPTAPAGGYDVPLGAIGGSCAAGEDACAPSGPCCPSGSACAPNTNNALGCGAGETFCCLSCGGGAFCGAGCCASGKQCTSAGDCGRALCCGPAAPAEECPSYVAATCPGGTTCLANHSARACGDWACYLPSGGVACPGEFACPDGTSFCPEGTDYCAAVSGVCLVGSTGADNWCCKTYANVGASCDVDLCHPGSSCVPNNGCNGSDPYATNVCYGPCTSFPIDCGNYCCPSGFPICAGSCYCNTY
jgi:hypothetical protein